MGTIDLIRRLSALRTVVLAAAFLLGGTAFGQERSDEEYDTLIHQLELGMAALEELDRGDALELLQRVTNQVREERARALRDGRGEGEENDEIREVRRRLGVMRHAVEAFMEAGREKQADLVERAMHARELAIAGRRDAEAQEIREAAPNRGQLAELLAVASRLHAEWGHPDRADMLESLSKIYAEQWKRRQRAVAEGRVTEERAHRGLEDRAARLEVIRLAIAAYREADRPEVAEIVTQFLHIGELQLEGGNEQAISEAAAKASEMANAQFGTHFSMGLVIELMQEAAGLYREWNVSERAASCNALAEFYAQRERDRSAGGEAGEGRERVRAEREIEQKMEELAREIEELQDRLRRLRDRKD